MTSHLKAIRAAISSINSELNSIDIIKGEPQPIHQKNTCNRNDIIFDEYGNSDYYEFWFDDWTISEDLDKILTDRGLKTGDDEVKSFVSGEGRRCSVIYQPTKYYVEDAMLEANIFEPERWDVDSPKFVLKDEKVDTWDKVIQALLDDTPNGND